MMTTSILTMMTRKSNMGPIDKIFIGAGLLISLAFVGEKSLNFCQGFCLSQAGYYQTMSNDAEKIGAYSEAKRFNDVENNYLDSFEKLNQIKSKYGVFYKYGF